MFIMWHLYSYTGIIYYNYSVAVAIITMLYFVLGLEDAIGEAISRATG